MANKKINQLVSKTAILSTDIFGIGDATTGQLFKKTIAELQAAIGGAVISVNGLVGTVVLDTDDIQELATPTNKYFTDARARGAISLTVTGNSGASTYSSGTGVLNVPTYTLAGLGGITATFLSGTSGISYNSTTGVISYSGTVYTDASIRALFSGATGISYNSTTGAISYSGTVYTDSSVRALISITTTGTSGASTYNNTTGVINVPNYTLAGLGGISLTSLSGGTGITYNNTTGAISYSGTVYTDASVRALISASGAVSYNNTTGIISLTSGNLTEATSSVLTITGGTGAVLGSGTSIQVKQASSTVSGFLSSTDWSTFNGKASALSGTTNYHAKFTSSSAIGDSLIYDNGTNIGVGTTTPNQLLSLRKTSAGAETIVLALQNIGGTANTAVSMVFCPHETSATPEPLAKISAIRTDASNAPTDIAFYTYNAGLSERMRINSSGNIGLGTSTPTNSSSFQRFLHIAGGASFNSSLCLSGQNTGGQGIIGYDSSVLYIDALGATIGANNTITFNTTSVNGSTGRLERLRITADGNAEFNGIIRSKVGNSGNVLVSTSATTGYQAIQLANTGGNGVWILGSSTGTNIFSNGSAYATQIGTLNDSILQFGTNSLIRATISSAGNVGIGGTPTAKLHVFTANNTSDGNAGSAFNNEAFVVGATGKGILIQYDQTNNRGHIGVVEPGVAWGTLVLQGISGNVLLGTSTNNGEKLYVSGSIRATGSITANSDIILKKNILKIENALEKVEQINGYTYELKEDDSKRHGGVIAQEIDKVFPEIVNTGNDGLMGVEYGNISALLIEAIKEQNIKIKNLETLLASK